MVRCRRIVAVLAACSVAWVALAVAPAQAVTTWQEPAVVTSTPAVVDQPHVAVSADGTTAVAMWRQAVNGTRVLRASVGLVSADGTSWGDAATLASGVTGSAQEWPVAISGNGGIVVVAWISGHAVRARVGRVVDLDILWGTPIDLAVERSTPGWPQLSLSRRGTRAVVTWQAIGTHRSTLRATTAVIGRTQESWGTAATVAVSPGEALGNSLAASSDGTHLIAAWTSGTRDDRRVYASPGTVAGPTITWGTARAISPAQERAAEPVATVTDAGSSATVVWQQTQSGPAPIGLLSSSAAVTAGQARWGTPTRITADQLNPQAAAVSGAGTVARVAAVWVYPTGAAPPVYGAVAGVVGRRATWTTPTAIGAPGTSASEVDVMVDASGSALVATWLQQVPGTARFQVCGSYAQGPWQAGSSVPISAEGSVREPRVAMSADGRVVVAAWIRLMETNAASTGVVEAASLVRP